MMRGVLYTLSGIVLGAALQSLSADLRAEPQPTSVTFDAARAAVYWHALQVCNQQLEDAKDSTAKCEASLAGEQKKTAAVAPTIQLACPEIPPCPACTTPLWEYGIASAIGAGIAGGVCAIAR